jgi:hypothetical protein
VKKADWVLIRSRSFDFLEQVVEVLDLVWFGLPALSGCRHPGWCLRHALVCRDAHEENDDVLGKMGIPMGKGK